MGAAPSAELLSRAPFRPPGTGARQIALLPLTKEYFPSPNCALFEQFYEVRTDPSVRYYMRYREDDKRQDYIPPIEYTKEELYKWLINFTSRICYPTNELLKADALRGNWHRIRPLPCALVFLYSTAANGLTHIPEGAVRLSSDENVYMKVIGGIGDSYYFRLAFGDQVNNHGDDLDDMLKLYYNYLEQPCNCNNNNKNKNNNNNNNDDSHNKESEMECDNDNDLQESPTTWDAKSETRKPPSELQMQIFITKSAGDHNMARMAILAAYVYEHQCLNIIGLPRMPPHSISFKSFKTNIPFLCFLREMRDRVATILECANLAHLWIDGTLIQGYISESTTAHIFEAFGKHFVKKSHYNMEGSSNNDSTIIHNNSDIVNDNANRNKKLITEKEQTVNTICNLQLELEQRINNNNNTSNNTQTVTPCTMANEGQEIDKVVNINATTCIDNKTIDNTNISNNNNSTSSNNIDEQSYNTYCHKTSTAELTEEEETEFNSCASVNDIDNNDDSDDNLLEFSFNLPNDSNDVYQNVYQNVYDDLMYSTNDVVLSEDVAACDEYYVEYTNNSNGNNNNNNNSKNNKSCIESRSNNNDNNNNSIINNTTSSANTEETIAKTCEATHDSIKQSNEINATDNKPANLQASENAKQLASMPSESHSISPNILATQMYTSISLSQNKHFHRLKGYIFTPMAVISANCEFVDEVYVVCVNSTVLVVKETNNIQTNTKRERCTHDHICKLHYYKHNHHNNINNSKISESAEQSECITDENVNTVSANTNEVIDIDNNNNNNNNKSNNNVQREFEQSNVNNNNDTSTKNVRNNKDNVQEETPDGDNTDAYIVVETLHVKKGDIIAFQPHHKTDENTILGVAAEHINVNKTICQEAETNNNSSSGITVNDSSTLNLLLDKPCKTTSPNNQNTNTIKSKQHTAEQDSEHVCSPHVSCMSSASSPEVENTLTTKCDCNLCVSHDGV